MGEGRGGEGEVGRWGGGGGGGGGGRYERGMRGGKGLRVHACTYTHGSLALTPIIILFLLTQEEKRIFQDLVMAYCSKRLRNKGKCH